MVKKFSCLKCGSKPMFAMWNSFITYKSNVDCFCLDCYKKELENGNWMNNCGYCKHFKTEICFDCIKSSKLEMSGVKRSELKSRFGKFLKKMRPELCGITVRIVDGDWIIPNYDLRRASEVAVKGFTRMPFD